MKKAAMGCAAMLLFLLVAAMLFAVGVKHFNGRVGVETDYATSPLLAEKPVPWTKPVTLKFVTFNIQDLWVVGRHRPERMRAIGDYLTHLDPDVAGFQEAFIEEERAILIAALAGSRLQYHQYYPSANVGSGLLIMSAHPIREVFFLRYSVAGHWNRIWEGDWFAGKGAALARIELPGDTGFLDFYSTHAQANYGYTPYAEVRRQQLSELAAFINSSRLGTAPAIVVGDFNSSPSKPAHQALTGGANLRRIMNMKSRIDHIFAVDDPRQIFEVLDTVKIAQRVQQDGKTFELSDHPGYMTTVRIVSRELSARDET